MKARKPTKKCKEFLSKIFNKTDIDKWLNDEGLVNKTNKVDKRKSEKFKKILITFIENPSAFLLKNVIDSAKIDLKCKFKREGVLHSIVKALDQAYLRNVSVSGTMIDQRNRIRRSGRKVKGKCLGTTLLTKEIIAISSGNS